jgi:hypothetical protein
MNFTLCSAAAVPSVKASAAGRGRISRNVRKTGAHAGGALEFYSGNPN